jgi:hypothetical protein
LCDVCARAVFCLTKYECTVVAVEIFLRHENETEHEFVLGTDPEETYSTESNSDSGHDEDGARAVSDKNRTVNDLSYGSLYPLTGIPRGLIHCSRGTLVKDKPTYIDIVFVMEIIQVLVKVEGQVVPVLFLTEHHATKAYCGVEIQLHAFFTLALDIGEWSASCHGRFSLRERTR